MKRFAKFLCALFAAVLVVGCLSVNTYAAAPVCENHKVVKKIVTPAKYPSLTYKYKLVCDSCKKETEVREGKAKIALGAAQKKSLKFRCTLLTSGTRGEKACNIKVLGTTKVDTQKYEIIKDVYGTYFLITPGFNNIWSNKLMGTYIDATKKTVTWTYKTNVNTRNQKKLTGFIQAKYGNFSNNVAKIYKLSYKY